MHIKNKRGQSTVEYILLVTAVVAVMIVFATGTGTGGFQGQLGGALNNAAQDMNSMAGTLTASHAPSSVSVGGKIENIYTVDVNEGGPGQ